MSHVPRAMSQIADDLDDIDDTMAAVEADGVVTLAEWRRVRHKVTRLSGKASVKDLEAAYAAVVERCGYHSPRATRLRRQLEALRLREGGADDSDAA